MKCVWQILVPTISNEGKPFRTRYHRVWDKEVKAISGGLTICPVTKGKWVNAAGKIYEERMIPVNFIATRAEAEAIADYTLNYYDQEAVLIYKLSDEYILRERTKKGK